MSFMLCTFSFTRIHAQCGGGNVSVGSLRVFPTVDSVTYSFDWTYLHGNASIQPLLYCDGILIGSGNCIPKLTDSSAGSHHVRETLPYHCIGNLVIKIVIWSNNYCGGSNCTADSVVINQTPLPVVLESFTASLVNQHTIMNWSTASESYLNYFSVERSTDGIHFSQAGMVFAKGNNSVKSSYSFTDNIAGIQVPVVYYRLNLVDVDGKSRYSNVRMVTLSGKQDKKIAITSYPDPVIQNVNVTIPASWQNQKVIYEVFSSYGICTLHKQVIESSQTEALDLANLAPGMYIIKASCNGQVAVQKIIKQ